MGRPKGPTVEWAIAVNFYRPRDYGIPHAPTNQRPDGTTFISAKNPVTARR